MPNNSNLLPYTNPITGQGSTQTANATGSTALNWTTQFANVTNALTQGFANVWNAKQGNTPTYNINNPAGGAPGAGTAASSNNTMLWVGVIIVILVIGVGAVVLSRK